MTRQKEEGRRLKVDVAEGLRPCTTVTIRESLGSTERHAPYLRGMDGTVCYFGRNAAMMSLVGNQLKAAGIDAKGFMDETQLSAELELGHARMLVMGGGVEDEPRKRMKDFCQTRGILVLEHFAGPASLPATITEVLDQQN